MKMRFRYIHKEGKKIVFGLFVLLAGLNYIILDVLKIHGTIGTIFLLLSFLLFGFVTWFFRNPRRRIITDDDHVLAPADGKIVVIEEVHEPEYFDEKRLQVSIFMSPANVHVNRNPISGEVKYSKYHPGKYLVAWHPKSSTENERTTIVIDNGDVDVMLRQIAGKVARRIVNYLEEGDEVRQGEDLGFIKFGSRVDLFLPLDTEINVDLGQKVKGGITVIGKLN